MLFECNKRLISFRLIHLPFEFCFTPIYNKHLRFKHCERQIVVNLEASKVNDRIVVDPNICHGQASIRGTRIPVHQIVSMPANGDNIEELFKEYPSIERENILACLSYAASLAEKQITPIGG